MQPRNNAEPIRQLVENSAEKKLAVPHLDIVSLNTYQSLDIRSEKSMEQPPKGQDDICGGTCLRIPEDTFRKHVSDESFMIRFLMICIENERIGRISQQTAMRQDNDSKRIEQLSEQINALRYTDTLRAAQHKCLKDENMTLLIKQRQTQQLVREKEIVISSKEQEISDLRVGMQTARHLKSKEELSDKKIQRELENEIIAQKSKLNEITKKKEELEMQLRHAAERESDLVATIGRHENRLELVNNELQSLRNLRVRIETEHQQSSSAAAILSLQKQQLLHQLQQYRTKTESADNLQARLQSKEAELSATVKAAQIATGNAQMLERELAATQNQLRSLRTNENESIKKQFANLEVRLDLMGNLEKESQSRATHIQQLTRERDTLHSKVEQLVVELMRLEKVLTNREDECKTCIRLSTENSLLSKKLGVLQQCLKERNNEIERLSKRPTAQVKENKNSNVSLKDLFQSAQSLKGSNERMNRLLLQSASTNEANISIQINKSQSRAELTS